MPDLLFTSVELGLLYSVAVLGVFLTFRILRFPDLTVDGSFVTGAAVTGLAIQAGVPGLVAVLFGLLAGFLAGSLTAFLHIKLGIEKILSSILSLGMLYTINLRLMDGPNLSLLNESGVISVLQAPFNHLYAIGFLLIVAVAAKFFFDWFLQTQFGLALRATGDNEGTARSFGVNPNVTKFIGLGVSNALVGLAGGLVAQYQGFVDINMGIGVIILALAALMIGEALFSQKKIFIITSAIVIGAILYEFIINVALYMGLAGTDLKFVAALILIIALVAGGRHKNFSWST